MSTYKENIGSTGSGIVPQAVTGAAVTTANGAWVRPANARALAFICSTGAGGTSATYQVETGNDANGATPVDLTGYVVAHGASAAVGRIEVPVGLVPAGKYVGIKATVVGTAVVSVTCHYLDAAYPV